MDSSPFSTLPLELLFYILSFLEPHEYSGLPCTCQHALSFVNKKLDTAETRHSNAFPIGTYKSRTAIYVKLHRKWLEELASCQAAMELYESHCNRPDYDEDDLDL